MDDLGIDLARLGFQPANHDVPAGPIASPATEKIDAAFDIVHTEAKSEGSDIAFRVQVRGRAGTIRPKPTGQFAGSAVYSYVWPTSLNSASIGFDSNQGHARARGDVPS